MGQTFFLQGSTLDGEGYPLAHTTRAAPATVSVLYYQHSSTSSVLVWELLPFVKSEQPLTVNIY